MRMLLVLAVLALTGCGLAGGYQDRLNDIFLSADAKMLKYHNQCVEKYGLEPYDESQSDKQKQIMVNCIERLDGRAEIITNARNNSSSSSKTGMYSGTDEFGRPVYKDVLGNVVEK